ncbi:MAG: GMC family oxidoreductase [Rhodobacteraceae bacterium]|nr:GMC family oxidoreductase [Paracoccaceae bacterium]
MKLMELDYRSLPRKPDSDVLIVGAGWAGSIHAERATRAGRSVLLLERGYPIQQQTRRDPDLIQDEVRFIARDDHIMSLANETVTFRNTLTQSGQPMRRIGAFQPGEGIGGAGKHWNGVSLRWHDSDFKLASAHQKSTGEDLTARGIPLCDWPVSYADLEPWYTSYELTAGIAGQAGNVQGQLNRLGNIYESPRSTEYPLPPVPCGLAGKRFGQAAIKAGYHPYPRPVSHATEVYRSPEGITYDTCRACACCERFMCAFDAKVDPARAYLNRAVETGRARVEPGQFVARVVHNPASGRIDGVIGYDLRHKELYFQPADTVILAGYTFTNIRLLLLSAIAAPYNPQTGQGVVGRNYVYQSRATPAVLFHDTDYAAYASHGAMGLMLDDFAGRAAKERWQTDYVGGFIVLGGLVHGRPLGNLTVPEDAPLWGSEWKRQLRSAYRGRSVVATIGSMLPHSENYCDLDPNFSDFLGQPLLRITFDYRDNDLRMARKMAAVTNELAKAMSPKSFIPAAGIEGPWSFLPGQSTHNAGGTIMGTDPSTSVTDSYGRVWGTDNLVVAGASMFPHNSAYNPTELLAALTLRSAETLFG